MLSAMTDTQLGAPSPPGRSIAPSRPLAAGGDVPEAEATPSPPTGLMEAAKGEAAWGHVNHMDPLLEGDEEEDSELEAMDRSPTEMSSSSQIDIFEAVAALGIENGTFIVHDMASELSTDQSAATQSIYARGPGAPSSLQPQGEGAGFNGPYPGAGRTCSPGYPPQWPRPATQQQCAPSLDQEMSRSGETERACLAAQSLRQRSGDGMRGLAPVTGACKGKSPDAPAPAPAYAPTCFYDTSAIGGGDGADPATASSTHNPTALRAALHAIARAHRRFGPEVVPLQESDSESLRELLVADMDAGADTRGCDYYSTDCDAGEDETPAAGAACSQGRATTTGASAAPGTEGGGGAVLRETGLGPTAAGGAQPPRSDDAQWFSGGATLVAATEAPEARSASEGCSQELGEAALQQWAAASAPDGDVVRPLGGLRKRSRSVRVLCAEVEAGTFSDSQESVVTEESPSKRQRRGRKGRRGRGRRRRGRSRASLLSHKLRERQRSNAIRDAINGLRDVFAEPGGEAASDTAAPAAAPKSNLVRGLRVPATRGPWCCTPVRQRLSRPPSPVATRLCRPSTGASRACPRTRPGPKSSRSPPSSSRTS